MIVSIGKNEEIRFEQVKPSVRSHVEAKSGGNLDPQTSDPELGLSPRSVCRAQSNSPLGAPRAAQPSGRARTHTHAQAGGPGRGNTCSFGRPASDSCHRLSGASEPFPSRPVHSRACCLCPRPDRGREGPPRGATDRPGVVSRPGGQGVGVAGPQLPPPPPAGTAPPGVPAPRARRAGPAGVTHPGRCSRRTRRCSGAASTWFPLHLPGTPRL